MKFIVDAHLPKRISNLLIENEALLKSNLEKIIEAISTNFVVEVTKTSLITIL